MNQSRSIIAIGVFSLAMFVAVWMGYAVVTSQTQTLLQFSGALLLITAIWLGQRVWLLLIMLTSASVILYGGFGTAHLGQAILILFALLMFLLRKLKFEVRIRELEVWALLLILSVVQVYFRNPVGMSFFGSANVGGKPYLMLALAFGSSLILSTLIVPAKDLRIAMRLSIFGSFLGIPMTMLRTGSIVGLVDAGSDASRIPTLGGVGMIVTQWIASRMSPLRAMVRPVWGLLLLLSVALAAGSGFRNMFAHVALLLLLATAYHGGFHSVLFSVLLGAFALLLLAIVNLNFPLPGTMQRALSPLPGTWEEKYRRAADESTEWRVEMWKEALTSDRWIKNKLLGDGLGMSQEQLQQNQSLEVAQTRMMSGLTVQQENMLVTGSYHSGPVQTIRVVGYSGLAILLLTMIRVAVHFHRQIIRCRGTEWAPVALFFGMPHIIHPLFFTFVFGEYHIGVATVLSGMAMVRLLERNLPLPAYAPTGLRMPQPLPLGKRQMA